MQATAGSTARGTGDHGRSAATIDACRVTEGNANTGVLLIDVNDVDASVKVRLKHDVLAVVTHGDFGVTVWNIVHGNTTKHGHAFMHYDVVVAHESSVNRCVRIVPVGGVALAV